MMKRLFGISALTIALLLLAAPAFAQVTNPLTNVFYIAADGNCLDDACTSAIRRMCRNSATSTTIYVCDLARGLYSIPALPYPINGRIEDYTLPNPTLAPTAATGPSGACPSGPAQPLHFGIAWVNNGGVTLIGPEASHSPGSLKKVTVTRTETPPAGALGWVVYWSRADDGYATKKLCPSAGTLDTSFVSAATSTYDCSCVSTGGAYPAVNQTGAHPRIGLGVVADGVISVPTIASGTNLNIVTPNVRRLTLGPLLSYSVDSGATSLAFPPESATERHVCKVGCTYTLPSAALASITDAASNKRYTVSLHPGDYTGDDLIDMKSYVTLAGTDRGTVRVGRVRGAVDATEWAVTNLTAMSVGRYDVSHTVATTAYVVGCTIGVLDGSYSMTDARGLWAEQKQTMYSVGNLVRSGYWGIGTALDGTTIDSGSLIVVQTGISGGASNPVGIVRDEGGARVYSNGSTVVVNVADTSSPAAGMGCVLSPAGAGTRTSAMHFTNGRIIINSTNASHTADLSCLSVPTGGCAESGALATSFDLSGTVCEVNAADSSATLRGVYYPSDSDHVNWKVNWTGGRIALAGGATRYDVDNAETGTGDSVTLTNVEHSASYNGSGPTFVNGLLADADLVANTCKIGTIRPDNGGATREFCWCFNNSGTGRWACASATTANGPTD